MALLIYVSEVNDMSDRIVDRIRSRIDEIRERIRKRRKR